MTWTVYFALFFLILLNCCFSAQTHLYEFTQKSFINGINVSSHQQQILLTPYQFNQGERIYHAYIIKENVHFLAIKNRNGEINRLIGEKAVVNSKLDVSNKIKGFFSLFVFSIKHEVLKEIDWQGKCEAYYSQKRVEDSFISFQKQKKNCQRLQKNIWSFSEGFSKALELQFDMDTLFDYQVDKNDPDFIVKAVSSTKGKYYSSIDEINYEFESSDVLELRQRNISLTEYFKVAKIEKYFNKKNSQDFLKSIFNDAVDFHLMPYFSDEKEEMTCSLLYNPRMNHSPNIEKFIQETKFNMTKILNHFQTFWAKEEFGKFRLTRANLDLINLLRCLPNNDLIRKSIVLINSDHEEDIIKFLESHHSNIFDALLNCGTELCLEIFIDLIDKIIPALRSENEKHGRIVGEFLTKRIWPAFGHIKIPSLAFLRKMITIFNDFRSTHRDHYLSFLIGISSITSHENVDAKTVGFISSEIRSVFQTYPKEKNYNYRENIAGLVAAMKFKDGTLARGIFDTYFGTRQLQLPESLQVLAVSTIFKLALNETQNREFCTKFLNLLMDPKYFEKNNLLIFMINEIILQNLEYNFLHYKLTYVFQNSHLKVYSIFERLLMDNCKIDLVNDFVCSQLLENLKFYEKLLRIKPQPVTLQRDTLFDHNLISFEYEIMGLENSTFFNMNLDLISTKDYGNLANFKYLKTLDGYKNVWNHFSLSILDVPMPIVTIPMDVMTLYEYFKSQQKLSTQGKTSRVLVDNREYLFLSSCLPLRIDLLGMVSVDLKSWPESTWTTISYNMLADISFVAQMKTTLLMDSKSIQSMNGIGGEGTIDFTATTSLFSPGKQICLESNVKDGLLYTFTDAFDPINHEMNISGISYDTASKKSFSPYPIDFGHSNKNACKEF